MWKLFYETYLRVFIHHYDISVYSTDIYIHSELRKCVDCLTREVIKWNRRIISLYSSLLCYSLIIRSFTSYYTSVWVIYYTILKQRVKRYYFYPLSEPANGLTQGETLYVDTFESEAGVVLPCNDVISWSALDVLFSRKKSAPMKM